MRIRKNLKDFKPYEWQVSSINLASKINKNNNQIIRFDTNTSPSISKEWLKKLSSKLENLNINDYPDISYGNLKTSISNYLDINENMITVTNGSDEGLDIISKTFIDEQTYTIISSPTYMFYRVISQIMGGNVILIPRKKNFFDDEKNILNYINNHNNNIIFLCSPNNPTGNSSKRETVINFLKNPNVIVVVDEAYSEFSGKTLIDLTKKYNNLIILRTFSKAFSLAGARIGYIITSKEITNLLSMVRPPNSLSVLSLALAEIALKDDTFVKNNIKYIINERERCKNIIERNNNVQVYPSETNFLLVKFNKLNPNIIYNKLLQKGLIVRNISHLINLEKCLRFNIRTPEQNDILLDAFSEIVKNN